MAPSPIWLITGCSTGFGRELARAVLERGWRAAITARNPETISDLADTAPDRAMALALDVTDQQQIEDGVAGAEDRFGRIDVLVNNAGYGYQSSVEEGEEAEIQAQFDANVFGLFALTRRVLPIMRRERQGHIINVSSVAGFMGFAGSGYYAASKHAVEGWSDALALEVGPLGIKVTCVEPGPFRTDWAGRSLKQTPSRIEDYAETVASRMESTSRNSGTQSGDPGRAARAIIDISQHDKPPRHLVLGAWGLDAVIKKLRDQLAEIETWRDFGAATDFPKEES